MTVDTFSGLGLAAPLLRALEGAGYKTPTPIQAKAIPLLLGGYDILGIAQTGTGKTAAFTLPLLHNLLEDDERPASRRPPALILAPTRELVLQIADSVETYGRHLRLRHAVVMGGVGQGPQVEALRRGVDILVATPGRLLDLIEQRHVDLRDTEYLILDEADRMLDMGFIRPIRQIIGHVPDERQTLLFSATMPAEIAKLAREILFEPEKVEIAAKSVAVDRIDQQVHHMATGEKRSRLTELLSNADLQRVIVFTRTKHGADKVVKFLGGGGVDAAALHGNKSQAARQRALESFRSGRARVLVATDIAARGIDVDDVTHVINFDLPNVPEDYVHRIGRTARAGANGVAISFCDAGERGHLRSIEKLIRRQLTVVGEGPSAAEAGPAARKSSGNGRPARSGSRGRRYRRTERRAA